MKQIIENIYHVGDSNCSVYIEEPGHEGRTAASQAIQLDQYLFSLNQIDRHKRQNQP